jgi:hypothetical protein
MTLSMLSRHLALRQWWRAETVITDGSRAEEYVIAGDTPTQFQLHAMVQCLNHISVIRWVGLDPEKCIESRCGGLEVVVSRWSA